VWFRAVGHALADFLTRELAASHTHGATPETLQSNPEMLAGFYGLYPLRAVESFESDGAFDGIKSWPKAATLIVPITMLQIAKNSQLASVKRESVSIA